MQNDIIDFVDIKLQSAEQTRLRLKDSINYLYMDMCECGNSLVLDNYHELIVELLESACVIGLIDYCTKVIITEKVNDVYKLRSNSFKNDFMED